MILSALSVAEIALLAIGAFLVLHGPGARRAESLALGIGLALGGLSCLYQTAFLLGRPALAFPVEALLGALALCLAWRRRAELHALARTVPPLFVRHPISASGLALGFALIAVLGFLVPPVEGDSLSYHLPRVLLFQQEESLFLEHFPKYQLAVFSVGGDLLRHATLRFHVDWGLAWPDFLAYLSIALGTYALGRRHASERSAFCATVVVACFPQLAFQALTLKTNVFTAAAGVWSLLLAARLEERLATRDLVLLLLALAFGVSAKATFGAFALLLALAMGWRLARAHGAAALGRLLAASAPALLLSLVPLLILSQCWLFLHNHLEHGGWAGPARFAEFHRNLDGGLGAAANLVRYLVQSFDLLRPTDLLFAWGTGDTLSSGVERLYDTWVRPLVGSAGLSRNHPVFRVDWQPNQLEAWYGPLGFALALPALLLAAWRGTPPLRALAQVALGYALLFSAAVAWFPFNTRMLSPVFSASGPCIAWLLDRLHLPRVALRAVGAIALFGLFYTLLYDQTQPFRVLRESGGGRDRLYHPRWMFGEAAPILLQRFPEGSEVAVVLRGQFPIYWSLLVNPKARITMVRPAIERRRDPGFSLATLERSTEPHYDSILCLTPEEGICPLPARREGFGVLLIDNRPRGEVPIEGGPRSEPPPDD